MAFKKKQKQPAAEGQKKSFAAQLKERFSGDKVFTAFAGVFTLIGFLTVLALVLTANFLTEQVQIMTRPVSDVENPLTAQTELNTQAIDQVARALGIDLDR